MSKKQKMGMMIWLGLGLVFPGMMLVFLTLYFPLFFNKGKSTAAQIVATAIFIALLSYSLIGSYFLGSLLGEMELRGGVFLMGAVVVVRVIRRVGKKIFAVDDGDQVRGARCAAGKDLSSLLEDTDEHL